MAQIILCNAKVRRQPILIELYVRGHIGKVGEQGINGAVRFQSHFMNFQYIVRIIHRVDLRFVKGCGGLSVRVVDVEVIPIERNVGQTAVLIIEEIAVASAVEAELPWVLDFFLFGGCGALRGRFGGEGGKGFLGGGRVCAKAGGSVEVSLGGVGVALHRVGLGTLDIHIRIVGGQFVNDKRQILDRGGGLVQLDIRLGAAKIGGFTAGIHPDSAAEHGNGLGVVAFGQVFFTHR